MDNNSAESDRRDTTPPFPSEDDGRTSPLDCESKKVYLSSNQDKRVLIVMCLGLTKDNGEPLLDVTSEAWTAQPIEVQKLLCRDTSDDQIAQGHV